MGKKWTQKLFVSYDSRVIELQNRAVKQCLNVNDVPWSCALFPSLQTPPVSFWSLFDGHAEQEGHKTNKHNLLCKEKHRLADSVLTVFFLCYTVFLPPPSPAPCGKWPGPGIPERVSGVLSGSACVCTPCLEQYAHSWWSDNNDTLNLCFQAEVTNSRHFVQVYKITEGPENVFPQSASIINDLLHNLNFVSFISKEISVFLFFVSGKRGCHVLLRTNQD